MSDYPYEAIVFLGDKDEIVEYTGDEVVRCKDCKYRHKEWYQDKRYKDGGYWLIGCDNDAIAERIYGLAQDNDFCSYGERKEE